MTGTPHPFPWVTAPHIGVFIPSPPQGVWFVGPLPIRAYALCILAGVVVAVAVTNRRWVARGGLPSTATDFAVWAVPAGLIGARLYSVATSWQIYFGAEATGEKVWEIWKGGLGIPGGVLGGALGAWAYTRRHGIRLPALADALAVGLPLAQAIGRLGNYFNQELFGGPTTLPWGLKIDPAHRPAGYADMATYHPTFLYEALWNVGLAGALTWADRRFRIGHGRLFALYIAGYAVGRGWVEALRIDPANSFHGIRLNDFTAAIAFVGAGVYFVVSQKLRPGREDPSIVQPRPATRAGGDGPGSGGSPAGAGAVGTGGAGHPGGAPGGVVRPDAGSRPHRAPPDG